MTERLILPALVLSEFVRGWHCDKCRTKTTTVTLLYPQMASVGTSTALVYPVRCGCGGSGHIEVKLPTLLLGVILVQMAAVDAHRQRDRRKSMKVSALPSKILKMARERYAELIRAARARPPGPSAELELTAEGGATTSTQPRPRRLNPSETPEQGEGPAPIERVLFNMDEEEWRKLMHRLGFDADEPPAAPVGPEGKS
jgi:hypothetical protein